MKHKIFRQHNAADANEFGACRAVGRNQLRPYVQNCIGPPSYVFNPLTYQPLLAESRHWGEQAYDNNQAGRCAEFVPNIVRIRLIDIALH